MNTQNSKIGRPVTTSELQLQAACFQWAWNTRPETRRLLFHVPNGGKRSKVEASWLKGSGVVSGIPDLVFVWRGHAYGFELKSEKGVVSDAQQAVHKAWQGQLIPIIIIRTLEHFQEMFNQILTTGYSTMFAVL